jgi:hypothetical protein
VVAIGATGAVTTLLALAALPAAAGTPATLRTEYTFDAISSGVVDDMTGRGHSLTLSGNYTAVPGPLSPAVAFAPVSRASTPHKSDLNPAGREFAVTVTFRVPTDTSGLGDTPNMAQKGQFGDAGQWKMQLEPESAAVQCRFKGTLAARLLTSAVTGVDDGQWHTATCWRAAGRIGVQVDGTENAASVWVGHIANTRPMLIGAKSLTSSTDQFTGEIDYVAVAMGDGAEDVSRVGVSVP